MSAVPTASADTVLGAYLRVSSDDQAERGTIATQRAELERWAGQKGISLRFFEDAGYSGTLPFDKRPGATDLLRAAAAHEISGVVVYRFDRIAREPLLWNVFCATLKLLHLSLESVLEPFDLTTAAGELGSDVLASLAKYQRTIFIEHSIAGQDRIAREGRWVSGIAPYGYVLDARRFLTPATAEVVSNRSEADVVRNIFDWYVSGVGAQAIAKRLNDASVPTSYGARNLATTMGDVLGTRGTSGKRLRRTAERWTDSAVRRLLRNETYAGRHVYGRRSSRERKLITRDVTALVTPEVFVRAQRKLQDNLRFAGRHSERDYLLRGLLTCGECGHVLVGAALPDEGW